MSINLNILGEELLPAPSDIKHKLPLASDGERFVERARDIVRNILLGSDPRLLVVVGPCSIHAEHDALAYAERLRELLPRVDDVLYVVMRAYFEKPRTTTGWKGFINDPHLDDSFRISEGLERARRLLIALTDLGLPLGTEALDPITPQYLDDLISWTAIGARTTESQKHRELASGLSTPVGFKNGTDGNVQIAINALQSAASPHHFLGMNQNGQVAVMKTRGNGYGHVVLRGSATGPNYDSVSVAQCEQLLRQGGCLPNVFIDCSHGNSRKDPALQPLVLEDCVHQILEGNLSLMGVMLESHLEEGRQDIPADVRQLRKGVSVTDACIGWNTTELALLKAAEKLRPLLDSRLTARSEFVKGTAA